MQMMCGQIVYKFARKLTGTPSGEKRRRNGGMLKWKASGERGLEEGIGTTEKAAHQGMRFRGIRCQKLAANQWRMLMAG